LAVIISGHGNWGTELLRHPTMVNLAEMLIKTTFSTETFVAGGTEVGFWHNTWTNGGSVVEERLFQMMLYLNGKWPSTEIWVGGRIDRKKNEASRVMNIGAEKKTLASPNKRIRQCARKIWVGSSTDSTCTWLARSFGQ